MQIKPFIESVLSIMAAILVLSTSHPHHRRRQLARPRRQQRLQCPHVTRSHALDYTLMETHIQHINWDIETIEKDLACKLDKNCNLTLLDDIARSRGSQTYRLSHSDLTRFDQQMANQLRKFYGEFLHVMSQLTRLQNDVVLDTRDTVVRDTRIFVNDLREFICNIENSANVKSRGYHVPDENMDESTLYMKYIPLLKDFKSFITQCESILKLHS